MHSKFRKIIRCVYILQGNAYHPVDLIVLYEFSLVLHTLFQSEVNSKIDINGGKSRNLQNIERKKTTSGSNSLDLIKCELRFFKLNTLKFWQCHLNLGILQFSNQYFCKNTRFEYKLKEILKIHRGEETSIGKYKMSLIGRYKIYQT